MNIDGNLVTDTGVSPFINNGFGSFQSQVSAIFRVFQQAAADEGISDADIDRIRDVVVPAIWQSLTADYSGTAGSFAEALATIQNNVGSTSLASAIWDALAADYNNPDSMGFLIQKKKISAVLGSVIKEL